VGTQEAVGGGVKGKSCLRGDCFFFLYSLGMRQRQQQRCRVRRHRRRRRQTTIREDIPHRETTIESRDLVEATTTIYKRPELGSPLLAHSGEDAGGGREGAERARAFERKESERIEAPPHWPCIRVRLMGQEKSSEAPSELRIEILDLV
jgi:hypothetical protein